MLRLHHRVSPTLLFVFGLLMLPAFVFQPLLPVRLLFALVFLSLALASGKRFRPLPTLAMALSIVAFNLTVPFGKVLLTVGGWSLTQGALLGGVEKAVTVEGLIWLSQVTIRPDLRLPGMVGELLAGSFAWQARIGEAKSSFDRKDIFGSLDRLLLRLESRQTSHEHAASAPPPAPARTTRRGVVELCLLGLACIAPYLLLLVKEWPAGWAVWLRP